MTSQEVTFTQLDEAPQRLFCEFLSGFFDGQPHEIVTGRGAFSFPKASFAFDQASLVQPLDGSGVNILIVGQTVGSKSTLEEEGKRVVNDMRWDFYVRAANVPEGQGNAAYACRRTTDLLRGVLMNDASIHPLAQKGIFDLSVQESTPIESLLYHVRRLRARGRFNFSFYTQPPTP